MVRGLYTSATGALVAQANIDAIANNLANVNTNGFKRTLLQVQSQKATDLYRFQTDPGQNPLNRLPGVSVQVLIGQLGSGAQVYDTPANFEQGPLVATGNSLDFALSGAGFFTVRDGAGNVRYTRDGTFVRSPQGQLVTEAGDTVLGTGNQPIQVPANGKLEVDRAGVLHVNGATIGTFAIAEFGNLTALRPEGANKFYDGGNNTAQLRTGAGTTSVLQYASEKSNANVVRSMVDLITNQRWFEANEKSITSQDDATGQAIAELGRNPK